MPVNIGPRIGIDGEAEFRKQLNNIIQQSKTLASEQKKVTAQFENSDDAMGKLSAQYEVLTRQVDNQRERVRMLEKGLASATDQFGEADTRTQKWQQAVNEATAQLSRMEHQMDNTSDQLEKARTDQAQSEDAYARLTRAIEDQESELQRLRRQYQNAVLEFGSASTEARDLERQIQDVSTGLGKNRSAMKRADDAADDLERELDQAGDAARDLGDDLDNAGRDALSFADVVGGNVVADALGSMIDGIGSVVEESKEYRRIMASLETSSERAGYTTEETAEAFETLVGVLDDDQTAATTVANLQAIGLEQENLLELLDGVIGAWASYGDSIPIDGLAESVNETIRSGQVAGNLADVLNWGTTANERFGVSLRENTEANEDWNQAVLDATTAEDYFNLALQECQTEADRANLVMGLFASQGLAEAGRGWQNANTALTEANEATARQREALAELAETITPVTTAISNATTSIIENFNGLLSQVNWDDIGQKINSVVDSQEISALNDTLGKIGPNLVSAVENAAEELSPSLDRIVEMFFATVDKILDKAAEASKELPDQATKAADNANGLLEFFIDTVEEGGRLIGEGWNIASSLVSGGVDIIGQALEDANLDLSNASQNAVNNIQRMSENWWVPNPSPWNDVTFAIAETGDAVDITGGQFSGMSNSYIDSSVKMQEATSIASDSMDRMAETVSSNSYGMMSDFEEATDNIASSASENFGQAQRSVSNSTRSMSTTAGTNAQSMRRNIANGANGAKSDVDSAFNSIESTVSGVSSRASSYGSSMMRNYQSGVSSQKGDLSSTISSIANSIISKFEGLGDNAVSWGKNIVSGMEDGINRRKQDLYNILSAMASKIKRTIERAYEINSPSKWAEDTFGLLMRGFGLGIINNEDSLIQTVQQSMNALKDVVSGERLTGQMNIAYSHLNPITMETGKNRAVGSTTNLGGVTIHVYAAEGQDPNMIANMVMHKMQLAVEQRKQVFG